MIGTIVNKLGHSALMKHHAASLPGDPSLSLAGGASTALVEFAGRFNFPVLTLKNRWTTS